jgi:hypothetical protein
MTITKNPVPEKFGEAPAYNPGSKPKYNGKPSFKRKPSKN